jgi:hypothetical protein
MIPWMKVLSVSFVGLCTRQFDAMRRLYTEAYGLPVIRAAPGVAWFKLDDGAEAHVYADTDEYHAFFGAGPVNSSSTTSPPPLSDSRRTACNG